MYRWYESAKVWYVYFHGVPDLSFPTEWTLQNVSAEQRAILHQGLAVHQ